MSPAPFAYLAIAVMVGLVFWYVRKAGKDAVRADEAKAAERIAEAGKDPIRDIDDLADRLQRGGKL